MVLKLKDGDGYAVPAMKAVLDNMRLVVMDFYIKGKTVLGTKTTANTLFFINFYHTENPFLKNQFFSFFDSIIKLDFCPGFVMIPDFQS